jgi:[ribosomal protein S5]-alanine N-acetyltransferase
VLEAPDPPLSDGVVTLRPSDDRDLGAIERGTADPDVIRSFGRPTRAAAEVLELNRQRWVDGVGATFAICEHLDACAGLVFVNLAAARPGNGGVGYWLLPEARGRGLATRAVRLVSQWALRDLGLARLGLYAEPWNRASQRVAERAGFHLEGTLRAYAEIDGRRADFVSYSLLPGDL